MSNSNEATPNNEVETMENENKKAETPVEEKQSIEPEIVESDKEERVEEASVEDAEIVEPSEEKQEEAKPQEGQEAEEEAKQEEPKPEDREEAEAKPAEVVEEENKGKKKKNAGKTRAAQILAIFAAPNYYANGFNPAELRTTLEDLGPTYVKIGQIMSSRPDLLPESYCKELEKLRQTVKPLDPAVAREVIEKETGKKIDEIFSEFRDEPLGSASIGQAHYAVLKDGTKVVVKVQRPLIAEMMRTDYILLKKLAKLVNVVVDSDTQSVDLLSVIEELEKVTEEELDFRVEAANTKMFKEQCIPNEEVITCPTVIDELTTERMFTMTFVDGYSISKKDRIVEDGYDPAVIGKAIVENYVHQVLDVGVFHADPHQGNIMVSQGKPYWIDFGMIGRITSKQIDAIQTTVLALLAGDASDLVDGFMALGATTSKTNIEKVVEGAELLLNKYSGARGVSDIDMSEVFDDLTDFAGKYHMTLPGEFTMLGRSILTFEGVIEQLCPELDLFKIISDKMVERVKASFDLKKKAMDIGKELLGAGKQTAKIPVLISDALSGLSKGKMKINMSLADYEEPAEKISAFIKYIVLCFMACVLFIGSCVLAGFDIQPKSANGLPILSIVGMVISVGLALWSILKMSQKKK